VTRRRSDGRCTPAARALPAVLAAATTALALCACGLPVQAASGGSGLRVARQQGAAARGASATAAERARIQIADRTHRYPAPAPPDERGRALASPTEALVIYATVYINWNAQDVVARLRALARASVGQARSAMLLQAAEVGSDPELRQAGIANHGSVEAVAPLIGGPAGSYAVVTREWTTASDSAAYQGLAPAWHLTLAQVRRQGRGGWVVSGWQPES
jgi:hypothetical protein